jgi:hypothetical protein
MYQKYGGILEGIDALHGEIHGLTDDLPDEEFHRIAQFLERRASNWRPSSEATKAYDDCVLALIHAVLEEYKNCSRVVSEHFQRVHVL